MAWLTSRHAIRAALERGAKGTLFVATHDPQTRELAKIARGGGVTVRDVPRSELRRLAGSAARSVALNLTGGGDRPTVDLRGWLEDAAPDSGPIVMLDHVTDPHNLGAIVRSAYLFGAALVIVAARRGATGGEAVDRASAGASRHLPVSVVPNLRNAAERCRAHGRWVYAVDMDGVPLPEATIAHPICLILGAEGHGVSAGLRSIADGVLSIPMHSGGSGAIDSLNVSVAAGVVLYELFRRRRGAD